jgi:hypothetical protein
MKPLFICAIVIFLMIGCATAEKCMCPAETAYIVNEFGCWTMIPEGALQDPETDYYTEYEWNEMMREYQNHLDKLKDDSSL